MKNKLGIQQLHIACSRALNIAANYEKVMLHPVFAQQLAAEQPIGGVDLRQVIITPDTYNGVTNITVEALASGEPDVHHTVLSFDAASEIEYHICYLNLQEDTVPWPEMLGVWSDMVSACLREKELGELEEMLKHISRVWTSCPNINYTYDWEEGYHFVTYKGIAMLRYRDMAGSGDLRTNHPLWIPFLDELEEHS